jgi:MFS family permease
MQTAHLSDLLGAKRVFAAGWVVLAAASLVAGLAISTGVEIAARAAQGAGAALIAPSALEPADAALRR